MFDRFMDFLGRVNVNGIMAIFVTMIVCFFLGFAVLLAMIPVSILGGDVVAKAGHTIVDNWPWFRIIYAIVLFEMMAESYGFAGLKSIFCHCHKGWKKWREQKAVDIA